MKIETYQDGILVETRTVDEPTLMNLSAFIGSMMRNNQYNKMVSTTTNRLAKDRLELAVIRLELKPEVATEDLQTFKELWDSVVDATPIGLLEPNAATDWTEIAQSNGLPFLFGSDFKLIIQQAQ